MLPKRTIELRQPHTGAPSPLITREALADCAQAGELLRHAQDQADEILRQAHAQRDQLLAQAEYDFWQRTNRQLSRWQATQQAVLDNVESIATSVTHHAIRSLLDDTTPVQRVSAMLKQLLTAQAPAIQAKLLCNPLDQPHVERWLNHHSEAVWQLHCDESIAPSVLILEAEEGSFRIDWTSSVNALLTADTERYAQA